MGNLKKLKSPYKNMKGHLYNSKGYPREELEKDIEQKTTQMQLNKAGQGHVKAIRRSGIAKPKAQLKSTGMFRVKSQHNVRNS